MTIMTVLLIAFGLAMDAFAVSIASGAIVKKQKYKRAFTFGFMFGAFQMIMPIVGYAAGNSFRKYITGFDHWIAFGLLTVIGIKMIYEAMSLEQAEKLTPDISVVVLLGLAIATSIDALAVGLSFAFLNGAILLPVLIIGIVTFSMSFLGVLIGQKFGALFEKKIGILGGLVLIGIGIKILLTHLP